MDKFTQALAQLWPQGFAFPRDEGSTVMRVTHGLAAALQDFHDWAEETVFDWMPHLAVARLAEWEDACGLPDACFGTTQDMATRRKLLLMRLQPLPSVHDDSSPASPATLAAICEQIGFEGITFAYNTPFRVGRDRVGRRLGALNGKLWVFIPSVSTPFRVGRSRVGDRLIERTTDFTPLECYLKRIVPARFEINTVYL